MTKRITFTPKGKQRGIKTVVTFKDTIIRIPIQAVECFIQ